MPPHAVGESVSVRTGLVRGAGCKLDRVCDASAEDCRPDVDLASLQPQSAYLSFERLANGGDAFPNDCHWMLTLVPCAVGASPSAR
jgi:hypothetical protein